MAALRMMFSACVYSLPGLRPAELVRQIDRRRFFGLAAWAGFTWPDAASSADLYRGFGKTQNQLDRQIRESLFRSTSTPTPAESRPRNYGDLLLSNDRLYYTAESLLLSTLPVECPPLDVLRTELEKLYVLRDDIDMLDVGYGVGLGEPVRLISKRSAFSDTYWAVLREAQTEAVSAVVASRPLFRLFLSTSTAKPGSRRLDELQQLITALEEPLVSRDRARAVELQTSAMRALLRLGNLLPPKFPYEVCKAVACDGLPRLLGRAEVEMVVERGGSSKPVRLTLMLDGYSAPVTAGNFVDLVQRGFYNGLPINIAVDQLPRSLVESGGVVASGQPSMLGGDITGFVDPRTGEYRELPLERWLQDESEPSYELPYADEPPAPAVEYRTSQDGGAGLRSGPRGLPLGGDAPGLSGAETQASGTSPAPGASASAARGGPVTPGGAGGLGASGQARSLLGDGVGGAAGADGGGGDEPAIARPGGSRSRTRVPFCVAGSIGMLHSRGALNDGSSEFFILTRSLDPNTPEARDLESRYALFGYVLEGADQLAQLATGNMVTSVVLRSGGDSLLRPGLNPTYTRRSSGNLQRDYGMLSGEGMQESTLPADVPAVAEELLEAEGYLQGGWWEGAEPPPAGVRGGARGLPGVDAGEDRTHR